MKFLANENFPQASVLALKEKGHDIISIGVDFMGITDIEVIQISNLEHRTILTFEADYGALDIQLGQQTKGWCYLFEARRI